ncbi:NfeD family protein [Catenulispora subtropica]|uniref:NfeD family protein n=1 Tax=Catenulispora subtropica TaxID=450798 RepID=A0ABN2QNB2_9ACTN
MHAWMVWAVAAAVLIGLELATTTLVLAMLGVGAAAAAVGAGVGGNAAVQIVAFGTVSVATLVFARPAAMKRLHGPEHRQGTDRLLGAEAVVVERVDGHDGRVRISGEIWSARAYDGQSEYAVGDRVDVAQIDGATALVL